MDASPCPAVDWAASGCMALTGRRDGPPLDPGFPILAGLRAVGRSIATLSGRLGRRVDLNVAGLLIARAAESGFTREGAVSANQTCRLLAAGSAATGGWSPGGPGWWAVNLARPEDRNAVPAALAGLTESDGVDRDPFEALEQAGAAVSAEELVARCRLLGIPAAPVSTPAPACWPPWSCHRLAGPSHQLRGGATVVDLSALWAGPLCGHILSRAGLAVTKVETPTRPDSLRWGTPGLFARLHADQELVRVDLSSPGGRDELRERLEDADVVIEGSRGRALDQLELGPATIRHRPGAVWLTITGYGRHSPWVAFGDDAAVAAGLVAWDQDGPVFVGDAIADPISGLVGALGVLWSLSAGGGHLIDLAMRDAVAAFTGHGGAASDHSDCLPEPMTGGRWRVRCRHHGAESPVLSPDEVAGASPAWTFAATS